MDNDNYFEEQQIDDGRFRGPYDPFGRGNQPPSPPPGFSPDVPRRGEEPAFPPPGFSPDGPRSGGRPPSAPPNFIPDAPRMGNQPFAGSENFDVQFRGGGQGRPRNIWGCLNRFTYIWLINGNNFWFYPVIMGRQYIEGFRWINGRWEYRRINMRRILIFRCF